MIMNIVRLEPDSIVSHKGDALRRLRYIGNTQGMVSNNTDLP